MRICGEEDMTDDQQEITFDPEELEAQPLTPELIELARDPNVETMLRIAERWLGGESSRLRQFAEECQKVIKGETKDDRRARMRYVRRELFG
jgi:hypothetical protein